jgi:hypothetical protein
VAKFSEIVGRKDMKDKSEFERSEFEKSIEFWESKIFHQEVTHIVKL